MEVVCRRRRGDSGGGDGNQGVRLMIRSGLSTLLALSILSPCGGMAQEAVVDPAREAGVAVPVAISATLSVPLGQWVRIGVTKPDDATASRVRIKKIQPGADRDVTSTENNQNLLKIDADDYAFTFPQIGQYIAEAIVVTENGVYLADALFTIGDEIPSVKDVPFPSPDGLRVLIIEETAKRGTLPAGQQQILLGEQARSWLDENTVSDEHVGWRIWDDDFTERNLKNVDERFRTAYSAAKESSGGVRPWLIAVCRDKSFNGPLPNSSADFITTLENLR